jgi:hypothetical protein
LVIRGFFTMANPFKNLQLTLPPEVFRDLKVRLLLLGVFVASVALAWWSIGRLPLWEKKLEQESSKISQFESEIEQLERRWNPQEAAQMTNRFKLSQEQIMAGPEEVVAWQADLKRRADQFTLSVNPGIIKTQECPLPGKRFSIVSATVDLRAITPGIRTNSPYLRLVNFAQDLTSQKKRVDLVEVGASGSSNSVSEARLGLQIWSLDNLP